MQLRLTTASAFSRALVLRYDDMMQQFQSNVRLLRDAKTTKEKQEANRVCVARLKNLNVELRRSIDHAVNVVAKRAQLETPPPGTPNGDRR